jgi:hypothetical protein
VAADVSGEREAKNEPPSGWSVPTVMRYLLSLALVATAVAACRPATTPAFIHKTPWQDQGIWLRADTHIHTRFSDGAHTVDEVVERARLYGCDVVAITDHADAAGTAATPAYAEAIRSARAANPELVILGGLEWNVPPGKGDDHAVVLFPDATDLARTAGEFKRRFDDLGRDGENPELAEQALEWLRGRPEGLALVVLNHPSRRAASVNAVRQRLGWLHEVGDGLVVGVEGAPGHQRAERLGAYGGRLRPDDRWDPAIAPPGGAWDQLLGAGVEVWGALATSDFHSERNGDYWPCQFSSTYVYAPDRTVDGVLRALREGAFFAELGGLVRHADLTVYAKDLPRLAWPGETIDVLAGDPIDIEVRLDIPATDWRGDPNHVDIVDIIATTPSGTTILQSAAPGPGTRVVHVMEAPEEELVIRARGRRVVEDGPDLLFYTNGVRVR